MAVYPAAYDALSNPGSGDSMTAVAHAAQHTNANDAIEAIEAELGLVPSGASLTVSARLDGVEALAASTAGPNSWLYSLYFV